MKIKKIISKIFLDDEEKKFIKLNQSKYKRNILSNDYIFRNNK